jgi:hypothetical protein
MVDQPHESRSGARLIEEGVGAVGGGLVDDWPFCKRRRRRRHSRSPLLIDDRYDVRIYSIQIY